MLAEKVRKLFAAPHYGVVATVQPDGTPQTSLVWVRADDEAVYFSTLKDRRKYTNLERDPHVSILVEADGDYVEVRGRAELTEQGGRELIDSLSVEYTGAPFRAETPDKVRVVVRVVPDKILTVGAKPGTVERLR
ncbi:TIGR03618 family F420-dependent PPOX class oxidoreductase [Nocardia sp. CDC159]|uniref:TIGR03618 family F420-dependent PPOX class oxidoreductase n=1 Tax=Nocardia pulmonis TaxID=2951408 RepID=A0A9X2EB68_9NOCA|nr:MULTISPECIES: TIGR03618 family F420-dependent PPOX class oxidoreductase [Nocardia]MCM6777704.1 TIGR03618 family F420-dependent PPOX class oxidoreductase [Nocardia pulmonis]MCM6790492.1 TIGR03618 family F420-dependent PPOX class oxidoreductase [Nocardia sp. CDC159]